MVFGPSVSRHMRSVLAHRLASAAAAPLAPPSTSPRLLPFQMPQEAPGPSPLRLDSMATPRFADKAALLRWTQHEFTRVAAGSDASLRGSRNRRRPTVQRQPPTRAGARPRGYLSEGKQPVHVQPVVKWSAGLPTCIALDLLTYRRVGTAHARAVPHARKGYSHCTTHAAAWLLVRAHALVALRIVAARGALSAAATRAAAMTRHATPALQP